MLAYKLGTPADYEDIHRLCYLFLKNSPYSSLRIDDSKVALMIGECMFNGLILLVMDDDKVVGFIAALIQEALFNRERWAAEVAWYVEEDYRGLKVALDMLSAYEYWAKSKSCTGMSLACLDKDLTKLYERKGFHKKETAFFKEI